MRNASGKDLANSLLEIMRMIAASKFDTKPVRVKQMMRTLKGVTSQTAIAALLKRKDFDDLHWVMALTCFEVTHRRDIPPAWTETTNATIQDFANAVARLPKVDHRLFPTIRILQLVCPMVGGVAKEADLNLKEVVRGREEFSKN